MWMRFGGIFDLANKRLRLEEVNHQLQQPDVWNDLEKMTQLQQKAKRYSEVVDAFTQLDGVLLDMPDLLTLIEQEADTQAIPDIQADLNQVKTQVETLEFQRMFAGPLDGNAAYLTLQAGSGGTEAQDWAQMLMRMYMRLQKGWEWMRE